MVVFAKYVQALSQVPEMHDTAADTSGMTFADKLRAKAAAKRNAKESPKEAPIAKTGQLYRVPRMHARGAVPAAEPWAAECITWPMYVNGVSCFRKWIRIDQSKAKVCSN